MVVLSLMVIAAYCIFNGVRSVMFEMNHARSVREQNIRWEEQNKLSEAQRLNNRFGNIESAISSQNSSLIDRMDRMQGKLWEIEGRIGMHEVPVPVTTRRKRGRK